MDINDTDALIVDLCSPLHELHDRGLKVLSNLESSVAEEVLTKAFAQCSDKDRAILVLNLGDLDRNLVMQALIERLTSDHSDNVRAQSAFALRRFNDKSVVPVLINALHDSSWKVILSASSAIKSHRVLAAIPDLLALLKHERWDVRLWAAEVLLYFGVSDVRILDALEALAIQPEAQEYEALVADLHHLQQQLDNEFDPPEDRLDVLRSIDEILIEARRLILPQP